MGAEAFQAFEQHAAVTAWRGTVRSGEVLWRPHPERFSRSNLGAYMRWLALRRQREFTNYEALWRWSITDLQGFWASIWDYFLVQASVPYSRVLGRRAMPGAQWFPGARLNYAEHALRNERPGADALLFQDEGGVLRRLSWPELGARVRIVATRLRELGLRPGDRVVAYLPNIPETLIAMLATTSIGAIWSCCGPEFGTRGVLDRFAQLDPKVLFGVSGYRYGGKWFERGGALEGIARGLDRLQHVIHVGEGGWKAQPTTLSVLQWADILDHPPISPADFVFEQVPFDHPLWIVFTSGTTGLPKPIVHGHGGILLEHLKHLNFNFDIRGRQRILFYTTTSWMMWNFLAGALLSDVVPVLYDGSATFPDAAALWKLIEESGVRLFGSSPAYIRMLARQGLVPRQHFRLAQLEAISLAGSPVSAECMAWCYENVKRDVWVSPGSGGAEVCTGFVGGVAGLPVRAGEIQARALGCAAFAFNEAGESVVNEVGELVITEPMPSMPLYFWRDPGNKRYLDTYFDRFPGKWRHGDLFRVTRRGTCLVPGRSDATLNRFGVRIGTSEIYRALEGLPEVDDSLIVSLELPRGEVFMPLFVTLHGALQLDDLLREKVQTRLREGCSPRHVPERIYQVAAIPYTRTGKKMELAVKRILMGVAVAKSLDREGMADPAALDDFLAYAKHQKDYSLRGRRPKERANERL